MKQNVFTNKSKIFISNLKTWTVCTPLFVQSISKYTVLAINYLGVLGAAVRHLPASEDLPAQDAVGPHVALAREPREIQHLHKINTVRDHVIVLQIQKEQRIDHPTLKLC